MEREVGGGIGMGNTCKPMAVSFQCMTKSTTKKKKKKKKSKKKQKKNRIIPKAKNKKSRNSGTITSRLQPMLQDTWSLSYDDPAL